jgi:hypothetical protein
MRLALLTLSILLTSKTRGQQQDIAPYYNHIYAAEEKIIDGAYSDAAAFYKQAFSTAFHPFALDVYNAVVCAALLDHNADLLQYASALILKGADTGFFSKHIFTGFKQSPEWQALRRRLPALMNARTKNIDTALIARIEAFKARDQAIHCLLPGNAALTEEMQRIDDSLSESLNQLLLDHDYFSEEVIGAFFEDTILSPAPRYGLLVLHQFQKDGDRLTATIEKAVKLGRLRPETALQWMENGLSSTLVFKKLHFVYRDTLRSFSLSSRDKRVLLLSTDPQEKEQRFRKAFYVDRPERLRKKIHFEYRSLYGKPTPFLFSVGLTEYSMSDDHNDAFNRQYTRVVDDGVNDFE